MGGSSFALYEQHVLDRPFRGYKCVLGCLIQWPFVNCCSTARRYRDAKRRDAVRRWLYQARIVPRNVMVMDLSNVPDLDRSKAARARLTSPLIRMRRTDRADALNSIPEPAVVPSDRGSAHGSLRPGDNLNDPSMYDAVQCDEFGLTEKDYTVAVRNHIDARPPAMVASASTAPTDATDAAVAISGLSHGAGSAR